MILYVTGLRTKIENEIICLIDAVQLFNKIKIAGGKNIEYFDKKGYYHEGAEIVKITDKLDPKRLFGKLYRAEHDDTNNEDIIRFIENDGGYKSDHRGAFLVNAKLAQAIAKEWLKDVDEPPMLIHATTHIFEGVGLKPVLKKAKKKSNAKTLFGRVEEAQVKPLNDNAIKALQTEFNDMHGHEMTTDNLIPPAEITAQVFAPPPNKTKTGKNKKNAGMAAFKEAQLLLGTPKKTLDSFEDLTPKYRKFLTTYGKDNNGKTGN